MRLIVIGLTLALAASAPLAATAQAPVSTAPLAPGQVLLELNATGSVVTRADSVTLVIRAAGEGATVQEANEAAQREAARIAGVARANAGAGASVEIGTEQTLPAYEAAEMAAMDAMNAAVAEMNEMAMDENSMGMEMPQRMHAAVPVTVRLRDISRVEALRQALFSSAVTTLASEPVYALADPASAQREARTRAIAAARSEAESYANALGMRVVRIARVTERLGFDFAAMIMGEQRMRRQFEENHSPDIETSVSIGVDFALAPR